MRYCRNFLLNLLILFIYGVSYSQDSYAPLEDSIWQLIINEADENKKLELIFENVYYYDFAPFTKAMIDEADAISDRLQLRDKQIETLLTYGQYYNFSSKYDSSKIYLEKALNNENIDDYTSLKVELLEAMAVAESRSDNIQKGINYFMQAVSILENPISRKQYIANEGEEDLLKMSSIVHNNLGNLYKKVQEYEEAIQHYDQAIEIMIALDAERYAATVIMNKGNALLDQQQYAEGLSTHREAKRLKVKYDATPRTIAFSDLNIGICLGAMDSLTSALEYINTALEVFEEIDNQKGITYSLIERGIIYNKRGEYERAVNDCQRSNQILKEQDIVDYQDKAFMCLYTAHKGTHNYATALGYHEDLKVWQDSVLSANNYRKIGQLESQFIYDKEKELQDLKVSESKKRNRLYIIGLLASLIGLGVITSLIYRNYRDKSKSERELAEKNAIISKSLSEKEILLREIHHRVKNNLQFISSLLALQTEHIEDKVALDAMQEGQDRVQSMALIHQNLYQEDNLTGVDMKQYFVKLIRGLFDSYNIRKDQITLELNIDNINLDVDTVIPIGLIVNELVSNSLKYAFPDRTFGTIAVGLHETDNRLIVSVSDNGIGMTDEVKEKLGVSFGYRLVQVFRDQLQAEMKIDGKNGTKTTLSISKYEKTV